MTIADLDVAMTCYERGILTTRGLRGLLPHSNIKCPRSMLRSSESGSEIFIYFLYDYLVVLTDKKNDKDTDCETYRDLDGKEVQNMVLSRKFKCFTSPLS